MKLSFTHSRLIIYHDVSNICTTYITIYHHFCMIIFWFHPFFIFDIAFFDGRLMNDTQLNIFDRGDDWMTVAGDANKNGPASTVEEPFFGHEIYIFHRRHDDLMVSIIASQV